MNPYLFRKLVDNNPSIYTLFQLYCSKHPTNISISNWLSEINFEALPPELSGMVANICASNGFTDTPQHIIPRLQGIIKYCHTLNLGMLAGLCSLGKQYNQAGISMLLMGATAIRIKYPDNPQQQLWQCELGVAPVDFPRATALAAEAGFTIKENKFSATAQKNSTQCIILYKLSPAAYLYQNAAPITFGGVSFIVPCNAALFVSLAEAAFRTLNQSSPYKQLITRLVHMHHIIASGIPWDTAATIAIQHATANQVRLLLEFYNQFVPEPISSDILEYFGSKTQMRHLADSVLAFQALPQNRRKLRKLWLTVKIHQADRPYTIPFKFLYQLFRAGLRRITS